MSTPHDDTRPSSAPDTDVDELAEPDEVDPETGTDGDDVPVDNPAG